MGQLEIQMAQQIAHENDRDLAQRAEFARVMAERGIDTKVSGSRTLGLRHWAERLHLAHAAHPAH
ncbi:hypothetical protein MWU75_10865 [Ornithinimicrobium sp. F0845]|uniref:hypothetical protein n=1 Tax=Ornithinimicrobium sp. F0845 TaxID=2926412 RepID=UPI001FF36FC4|nr:hypothetical protein [Ornithinimicrobium sp. F0845]MCK0112641.1 hypothetical protein [Ornithinimicrobium sp. F0845]